MKVQHNKQTKMTWSYIPTSVARDLDIKKGDEIDFTKVEKNVKIDEGFVVTKRK